MSWAEFIRIIPQVIKFVNDLNLPPRTTLLATGGIILSIAYSYRYFRPDCPQQRNELKDSNGTQDEQNGTVVPTSSLFDVAGVSSNPNGMQTEQNPISTPAVTFPLADVAGALASPNGTHTELQHTEDTPAVPFPEEPRVLTEREDSITDRLLQDNRVTQHIADADYVVGSINNSGPNMTTNIGSNFYQNDRNT